MNVLKIAIWNANGISQRKNELQAFLIHNKIDIMLISETHLTIKHFFCVKNYFFYDAKFSGVKAHGGSGILIRRGIKHYLHSTVSKSYIQATNVTVCEWYGNCVFSAVYCPPNNTKIDKDQFAEFFSSLGPKLFNVSQL